MKYRQAQTAPDFLLLNEFIKDVDALKRLLTIINGFSKPRC